MNDTVMPPTATIRAAISLLERAVSRLIKALPGCDPVGHYEADVESFNLLRLIIRHVEAVLALASRDLVLLPSAMVVARAAYETAIKLRWMARPDDPFDRESRCLAPLQRAEHDSLKLAPWRAKFDRG